MITITATFEVFLFLAIQDYKLSIKHHFQRVIKFCNINIKTEASPFCYLFVPVSTDLNNPFYSKIFQWKAITKLNTKF